MWKASGDKGPQVMWKASGDKGPQVMWKASGDKGPQVIWEASGDMGRTAQPTEAHKSGVTEGATGGPGLRHFLLLRGLVEWSPSVSHPQ